MVIAVRFLSGFSGRRHPQDPVPEWPPSPHRLLCALMATDGPGVKTSLGPGSVLARELAALEAPEVFAPRFVLVNEIRQALGNRGNEMLQESGLPGPAANRLSKAVVRPRSWYRPVDGTTVFYAWQRGVEDRRALQAALERISTIGRGPDFVVVYLAPDDATASLDAGYSNWLPGDGGRVAMFYPTPAQIEGLLDDHNEGRRANARTALRTIAYRGKRMDRAPVILRLDHAFPLTHACRLAEAIRATLLGTAFNEWVHAHDGAPHPMIVPLPTIHPRRHPEIHRVALLDDVRGTVTLPLEEMADALEARTIRTAAGQYRLRRIATDAVASHYFGYAKEWNTVTPIVLLNTDFKDADEARRMRNLQEAAKAGALPEPEAAALLRAISRQERRRERMIVKAATYAGLPAPEITFVETPGMRLPRAGDFLTRAEGKRYLRFPRLHVRLVFPESVEGPIVLGSGRFFGLGLLRRVASAEA